MKRNTRVFILYSLIVLGPVLAIALPILRYEPGLRLIQDFRPCWFCAAVSRTWWTTSAGTERIF